MAIVTTRPSATVSNALTIIPSGTAHGVLSDDSDASYLHRAYGDAAFTAARIRFTVPSIPVGAKVKQHAIRLRLRKDGTIGAPFYLPLDFYADGTTDLASAVQSVTWATPLTIQVLAKANGAAATQPELRMVPESFDGGRIIEAYWDTTYVAKPVVATITVDGQTGGPTLTTNDRPTIAWTNTLDSDGGGQSNWDVKIFDAATYGAGGFDPATSTPTANGAAFDASTSWQTGTRLADGTYRAYVKVAQAFANPGLTFIDSDWAFAGFTITVQRPGITSIVATPENANGRVKLDVETNPAGTVTSDAVEIQRSRDGGTTWEDIRTIEGSGRVVDEPTVVATSSFSDTANATTHAIPLPSPSGGIQDDDMLIAVVGVDGNPTLTWDTGWTEIKDEAGNGSAVRAGVAWKRCVGNETGTLTVTSSASEGLAGQILLIRGAEAATAPEVSTGVNSALANGADPDSLNPAGWGTENTLWIAGAVIDSNVSITAGPSGYYGFAFKQWNDATNGAGVATAYLRSSAASKDPGAFTHLAEDVRAFTIGVRPAKAATTLTAYDYESGNGQSVSYRAAAIHVFSADFESLSAFVSSSTVSWSSAVIWLKHPTDPSLNATARLFEYPQINRPANEGRFKPLGSTETIVVKDVSGGPQGDDLTFRIDTQAELDDIHALLAEAVPVLMQTPTTFFWPDTWISLSEDAEERLIPKTASGYLTKTLSWIGVAAPTDNLESFT